MAPKNKQPEDSAPEPLPPIDRKTLKSGLINQGAVSENERPKSSVSESINFHFDSIGSATTRKGSILLGNNLGSAITGMHYYVDTVNLAAPNTQMIVVSGSVAYYLAGTTYTSIRTGLTVGSKARFITFLNFAWMVNGTEATTIWDGTTGGSFVTTGNASGAPTGKFIENFEGRVWIAGNATYPDRVYYSTIQSAAATPIVSWSTDPVIGTQWFDVNTSDGDTITALQKFRTSLIVFKTNRIYREFGISQGDPDPYVSVGTSSAESVLETKLGLYFHHSSGFYQYNIYGIVQEVSRPIWDIIRAIPASQYPNITGWVEADQDHVCWALGTVTVNGTSYSNLVVRYTLSTQTWTHYQYPKTFTSSIRRQPYYTDGAKQYAVVGDTAGNVATLFNGVVDYDGSPISVSLIHAWDNIDGLLSTRKIVQTGNFSHYGGAGLNVAYQTEISDPSDLNNWAYGKIGQLVDANSGFNSMDIKARKVRFRVYGVMSGSPCIYNGFELLGVFNEMYQFDEPST